MRVVAGELRGRTIAAPPERTTRPTTDRVRESMFSSLFSRLGGFEGLEVLDAFAGSGALGIEALSRGAAHCTFFERDTASRAVLEDNLSTLGLASSRTTVRAADVLETFASGAGMPGVPFGLVLLDPPYALDAAEVLGLLDALHGAGRLSPGAVIAYEHAHANAAGVAELFTRASFLEQTGQKKYGKIGVTYLEHATA